MTTPGDYQGYFSLFPPGSCQSIKVPFQLTVFDTSITAVEPTEVERNAPFANATTCPTSNGFNNAYFNDPTGTILNDCWWGNLESGIELEITQAPDSSDFSLNDVNVELCFGTLSIDVEHSVSTLGDYQGYFIISAQDICVDIHVPFQFTITEPNNSPPLIAELVQWQDYSWLFGNGANPALFNGGESCPVLYGLTPLQ